MWTVFDGYWVYCRAHRAFLHSPAYEKHQIVHEEQVHLIPLTGKEVNLLSLSYEERRSAEKVARLSGCPGVEIMEFLDAILIVRLALG